MVYFETGIALVLIFGVLVMFHELGHFITARLVGMRVDEFAFGFGPKLITLFKRGDTEYTIHPIPAGGFVKIAGMEPGEEDIPDGFQAQARWKRALVIFSGPVASFVLAVLAFLVVGTVWGFQTDKTINRVLLVEPQTVAAKIGLRAGDRILSIDGKRVTDGSQMVDLIHNKPGEKVSLVVEREGQKMRKTAVPGWSVTYLGANWSFVKSNRANVDVLAKGSAADMAGVKQDDTLLSINGQPIEGGREMVDAIKAAGDRPVELILRRGDETIKTTVSPRLQWVKFLGARWIFPGAVADKIASMKMRGGLEPYDLLVSVNGTKIKTGEQMLDALRTNRGQPLDLVVKRNDEEVALRVSPTASDYAQIESGRYSAIGLLGFMPQTAFERTSFVESIGRGLERTALVVQAVFYALSPNRIAENVGGPVLIVQQTRTMVALGPSYVVQMAGMLSLSLGIINLIPIPVLDGGHIAILGVEAIRRKRLTPQQMQAAQMVGLAMILLLAVVVFWSDVWKLSHGLVPR